MENSFSITKKTVEKVEMSLSDVGIKDVTLPVTKDGKLTRKGGTKFLGNVDVYFENGVIVSTSLMESSSNNGREAAHKTWMPKAGDNKDIYLNWFQGDDGSLLSAIRTNVTPIGHSRSFDREDGSKGYRSSCLLPETTFKVLEAYVNSKCDALEIIDGASKKKPAQQGEKRAES
jgi:hypothetical protein